MSNIIKLPPFKRLPKPFPRQKVFKLGYSFFDPFLCQEDQQLLYLKRMGAKGDRWWQLIIYDKMDLKDKRKYSISIEACMDDELADMLDDWGFDIYFQDLRDMGWEGRQHQNSAKIIKFDHNILKIKKTGIFNV